MVPEPVALDVAVLENGTRTDPMPVNKARSAGSVRVALDGPKVAVSPVREMPEVPAKSTVPSKADALKILLEVGTTTETTLTEAGLRALIVAARLNVKVAAAATRFSASAVPSTVPDKA